jgi:parallel beta-helix repeat protein
MALGNGGVGVGVELSVTNTVIMGNTVSGSGGDGIFLQGATLAGVTGTVVAGDRVGTDASGTRALPNRGAAGVEVDQAAETTLDSDLIAGNAADGVLLHGAGTTGVAVRRSYIGLTVNGAALPNGLHGVEVSQGAADNTVSGNLVWFNGGHGVVLHDSGTTGNAVTGNTIAFNLGSGVIAAAGAADNAVGGTQAGQGNVITANLQAGVRVDGAATTGIVVEGNSIWGNAGAVAWGNPTLGLPGPGGIVLTAGGNDGQPAPVLGGAAAAGSAGTAVGGGLRAAPTTTYRVEFFDNPDGGDQGQTFLGFLGVTTDAQGNATFTDQFAGDLTALTATATGPNGNTSMFSAPVAVARL